MRSHPQSKVQSVAEEIGDHMDAILRLFKPGAKITVLVRTPDYPDGSRDMLMTSDDIENAIAALKCRQNPEGTLTGSV